MNGKRIWIVSFLALGLMMTAGCGAANPAAEAQPTSTASVEMPEIEPTIAPTTANDSETEAPTEAASTESQPEGDATRIALEPNTSTWYTQGDLDPEGALRFVISVMKGQQFTIWLDTEPVSSDSPLAYLNLIDGNGQSLSTSPEMYLSSIVQETQDYTIEIHSAASEPIHYTLRIENPATAIDPAMGAAYDLVDASVCEAVQQAAEDALGVDFYLEPRAPFLDALAGEAGQGCRLTAHGTGAQFSDAQTVVRNLVNSAGLGWNEQIAYQADGPTGSATAVSRDMALMLIQANWSPEMGVTCPVDQPIAECDLTPEQKNYTLELKIAQYHADFSLDGHWEDAATGFSLDLSQDWKNIWGQHTVVAQGGNKIDSLEASIFGALNGRVGSVQFQSSFASAPGTAEITYVDVNTITWKITAPPEGEYYLPAEATLTRK